MEVIATLSGSAVALFLGLAVLIYRGRSEKKANQSQTRLNTAKSIQAEEAIEASHETAKAAARAAPFDASVKALEAGAQALSMVWETMSEQLAAAREDLAALREQHERDKRTCAEEIATLRAQLDGAR